MKSESVTTPIQLPDACLSTATGDDLRRIGALICPPGIPGIQVPDTTAEDAEKAVDDETSEFVSACERLGIVIGEKPDDPPGDRCVPRLGESRSGEGYFVVWCSRSALISMRRRHYERSMMDDGIGLLEP